MSFEESEELPGQDDQSYSEPMDNWGYMYHGDIYYNLDEMPPEGVLESYHECNTWYIPAKCKSHADKLYEGFFDDDEKKPKLRCHVYDEPELKMFIDLPAYGLLADGGLLVREGYTMPDIKKGSKVECIAVSPIYIDDCSGVIDLEKLLKHSTIIRTEEDIEMIREALLEATDPDSWKNRKEASSKYKHIMLAVKYKDCGAWNTGYVLSLDGNGRLGVDYSFSYFDITYTGYDEVLPVNQSVVDVLRKYVKTTGKETFDFRYP